MRPTRPPPSPQAGFTLIELMTVIVIAAVLAAAALPSFFDAIERNRIVSQNNELLATFSFARSEAIKRNGTVGVCALNAALTGCATDNWNRGWLVWADTDRSATFNAGDEVLRINRVDPKDRLTGTVFDIRFGPRGNRTLPIVTAGNSELALQPDGCSTSKTNRRLMSVRATGAASSATQNCT